MGGCARRGELWLGEVVWEEEGKEVGGLHRRRGFGSDGRGGLLRMGAGWSGVRYAEMEGRGVLRNAQGLEVG